MLNPAGLHDPVPFGYSHLARVSGELVFIAGQYASDRDGHVVTADFAGQVRQSFANLRVVLQAVDLDFRHVVRLGTYIVGHDSGTLAALAGQISEIWGAEPPTQTLIGVAALALPGMLFEVDAVAAVGRPTP